MKIRGRRSPEPSVEQIAATQARHDALVAPLREDVRRFIDPTWDVTFTFSNGRWWFDIATDVAENVDGSFEGHLNAVACYVQEYLAACPTWPRCGKHGRPLSIEPDGREHIRWMCDSTSRHAVPEGHLAEIVGDDT